MKKNYSDNNPEELVLLKEMLSDSANGHRNSCLMRNRWKLKEVYCLTKLLEIEAEGEIHVTDSCSEGEFVCSHERLSIDTGFPFEEVSNCLLYWEVEGFLKRKGTKFKINHQRLDELTHGVREGHYFLF